MTATSLPARIGYAIVVLPLGAVLGYVLALKLLIKFGSVFQDPHSSMQGFGYFMMSLASAATFAATTSLIAVTLPWKRPIRANGEVGRVVVSVMLLGFSFLILAGEGNALIFVLIVIGWLAVVFYLCTVRRSRLQAGQSGGTLIRMHCVNSARTPAGPTIERKPTWIS
jgi:hypothetical protein